MQKQLKEEEGGVTMIYSFETEEEYRNRVQDFLYDGVKLMYNGTKINLCQMDEEFWKPLVEEMRYYSPSAESYKIGYMNYSEQADSKDVEVTAKESGLSAIEDLKGEFIIITQETK